MINEDEIIKSKLNAYRPSFEASDWAAMEKLLDKKEDRKPIVIWWTYGLAIGLCLFFGAGLTAYFMNTNHNTNHPSSSNKTSNISSISTNNKNTSISISSNNNDKKTIESTSNQSVNYTSSSIIGNHSSNLLSSNSNVQTDKNIAKFKSSENKEIAAVANRRILQEIKENLISNLNENNSIAVREKQALLEFNQILVNEIYNPISNNSIVNKNENFATINKRNSKIPFEYSLALQGSGLINLALNRNKINLYLDQFSDANIIGQMMIGNHIGVYAGVGYADRKTTSTLDSTNYADLLTTSFKVIKDKNIGVSVPVGVTANIYKHAYFNIYAKAGVNNIFFLKQNTTIQYSTNPTTTIPTNTNTSQLGNTFISSSADMLATSNEFATTYSNPLVVNNGEIQQKTYKHQPQEKYLAELNLAIGIKAKMTKNLSLVFEPAYRIGLKNKNRAETYHSVALSGAFVISF